MKGPRACRRSALALALGAVVLAGSCGTQTATRQGPPSPLDAVDSEAQAIRKDAYAFYDSWTGGRSGQTAAEVLIVHDTNGPLSECLNRAGYDVTWERGISGTTFMDGLNASRWLRDPLSRRYTWIAVMDAFSARVEDRQMHDKRVPDDVVDSCLRSSRPIGDEGVLKTSLPPVQQRLMADWDARITEAVASVAGDREDYETCVLDGNLPEAFAGPENTEELLDAIDAAMPPVEEVPLGDEEPSQDWQKWLDVEEQLLEVEWTCAEPVYSDAMRQLPRVIDDFAADHEDEIAELVAHWQRVKSDARALGWTEDRPFLSSTPEGWVNPETEYPPALDELAAP